MVPKYQGMTTQQCYSSKLGQGQSGTRGGCVALHLQVDFPWVFSQFGQWYMSMSGASSSSTPTQLKCRKHRHH